MMKKYYVFIIWILTVSSLLAQEREVISAAGDDVMVNQVNMSYTIGETVVALSTSDSMYVTAGFQQSNVLISIPLPIEEIRISAKVFPNPAVDYFYLDIDHQDTNGFVVVMHTTKGEFIRKDNVNDAPLKVSLAGLPTGVYYLTVLGQGNEKLHQFKILKIE